MAILIELYLEWNFQAISVMPSALSSGESWNKLFFSHKIMTYLTFDMTGRFWACHKTFWTLLPPIPQFRVFRGSWYFVETQYLFSPAAIESLIIIDLRQFVIKLEQWWRWKFNQVVIENLKEGTVVIMI